MRRWVRLVGLLRRSIHAYGSGGQHKVGTFRIAEIHPVHTADGLNDGAMARSVTAESSTPAITRIGIDTFMAANHHMSNVHR